MVKGDTRGLNSRQVEFFALGGALGSGIFMGVGQGIHAGGPSLLLAYALAGLVMYIVARCLGEMALNDEQGTSFVGYTMRYLGPRLAFVHGWAYWLCGAMVCMAELSAVGMLVHTWLPSVPQWSAALGGLLVLSLVNTLRVRIFGETEFVMTLVKIIALSIFLVMGVFLLLAHGSAGLPDASVANLWRHGGFFPTGATGFLSVLPVAAFAFGGTELICLAAAETIRPERALPRAIKGLLGRLLLFYVGTTTMIVLLVPWKDVPVNASPIVIIFDHIGLPGAGEAMSLILVLVLLSSCNSFLFGMARVLRALAAAGCAPAALGRLNDNDVPGYAVATGFGFVSMAIGLNYVMPGQVFGLLMNGTAMGVVAIWALFVVAHLRFRTSKSSGHQLVYMAPWFPASNLLVLLFFVAVTSILATDAAFRPVFAYVVAAFAVLYLLSWLCRIDRPVAANDNDFQGA